MKTILDKLNELKLSLEKHNYHYYVLDNPIISDKEWMTYLKNYKN